MSDVREDVQIVDLSRLGENLVGVKRRRYGVLRPTEPPAFPNEVEFIDLDAL